MSYLKFNTISSNTKWLNYDNCNNILFSNSVRSLKGGFKSIEQNKASLKLSPCVTSICLRCCGCMQSNGIWRLSQTDLRTISEDNPIETGSWATKPYRKTQLHSPSHFLSPCFVVYFLNSFQFNGVYLNGKNYVLLKFLLNIYLKWEYSNVVLVWLRPTAVGEAQTSLINIDSDNLALPFIVTTIILCH